jgi:hypothetical protein
MKRKLKVLITVKTYPIPSRKYDELVCTAGVTDQGEFVRLYPINFRDLPYSQQYRKYQWIEVMAERHTGRDSRKESWRPDCDTLRTLGDPVPTRNGNWDERAKYVLPLCSASMEELDEKREADNTSLGIFRPKRVLGLDIAKDSDKWKPGFLAALKQNRLWETRKVSREPPRKVPWKFYYRFVCGDARCNGNHRMMIEDWEAGALYWREVGRGKSPREAADSVRSKFLDELCGDDRETYFYVGTILAHPRSWVVIGVFYPKLRRRCAGENLFGNGPADA